MILVLILTFKVDMITAIAKRYLEMFRSEQDSNPDLCDSDTVIYQLSYKLYMGRGHLKISVLDRILTLTSAKPIESVECSTS